jgi:hypothetical protein
MSAGHGGRSGRFESLKETAVEYAFLLDLLGTPDNSGVPVNSCVPEKSGTPAR